MSKSIREQMQELFPHETTSPEAMQAIVLGDNPVDEEPVSLDDFVAIAQGRLTPPQYRGDEDGEELEWSSIDNFVQRSVNLGDPVNLATRKEEEYGAPLADCADATITTVINRPWYIENANHQPGASDVRKLRNTNARCLGDPPDASFEDRQEQHRAECVRRFIEQGERDEQYRLMRIKMDRIHQ